MSGPVERRADGRSGLWYRSSLGASDSSAHRNTTLQARTRCDLRKQVVRQRVDHDLRPVSIFRPGHSWLENSPKTIISGLVWRARVDYAWTTEGVAEGINMAKQSTHQWQWLLLIYCLIVVWRALTPFMWHKSKKKQTLEGNLSVIFLNSVRFLSFLRNTNCESD